LLAEAVERQRMEERQRLARDLHDSVAQTLYGIGLGINTANSYLDNDLARATEALNYALKLTNSGLAEMRALIFELRPVTLEMEGLVVALTKRVAALRVRHSIEVELDLCSEPDVSFTAKETMYRIAQEALQNVVKHAHATRLDVRLTCEPGWLTLEVCDNGSGFDAMAAHPGHLGLQSMRERAESVGGTLDIASATGCGTQIRARLPFESVPLD
jgi:signal transduction histidine kinase